MTVDLQGLIPAVFTPMDEGGALKLDVVGDYVSLLAERGVSGVLACGTTGEFPSLSVDERKATAEAFAKATDGRMPLIVHVGHNDLSTVCDLTAHAADIGAVACAAIPPSYFTPPDLDAVVDWFASVADAVPQMPLFYYHIPAMTGVDIVVPEFLRKAVGRVGTLAGVKYTHESLDQFALCLDEFGDRLNIMFGRDEMLLSGIATGATGAVGSSFSFASPLYRRLWDAFNSGDLAAARQWQVRSVRLIDTLKSYIYPSASKACMKMLGIDCGPPRPPFGPLTALGKAALRADLEEMGFFEW
ncbi:MAG: dihydrodipicolinate synthase family protein [Planctomycetota bacterium]|jgi:N-acetylneuraminate lyase